MSKHLNEALGSRYVHEFYNTALFEYRDQLCMVRQVTNEEVRVHALNLTEANPQWQEATFTPDVLKDFSAFKYPTLGYRQYKIGAMNPFVVHVSSKRSAHRGLRDEYLAALPLPIYRNVMFDADSKFWDLSSAGRLKELYRPKFTTFKDGIGRLLKGEIAGFAINENLAVGLATLHNDRPYEIYFRQRTVGHIDDNGNLQLSNKIINRPHLRSALEA